jgi:molybdopterin-guanine dinucleotide biosynthesis protein A
MISQEGSGISPRHSKLAKPIVGNWARNEIAIYGTSCSEVKKLVANISALFPEKKIAYVDESHDELKEYHANFDEYTVCGSGVLSSISELKRQEILAKHYDLVLVNGNHFQASKQCVVVNPEKENSLRKRQDQLENVVFLFHEHSSSIPEYVSEVVPNRHSIPLMRSLTRVKELEDLLFPKSTIKALVLTGGKSERMGKNKSLISYHEEPQYLWLIRQLESLKIEPHLSVSNELLPAEGVTQVPDTFLELGPMGGILSAFRFDPNASWLVLAVDMPALEKKHIEMLVQNHFSHFSASAFVNPTSNLPEPLLSIWEPWSYPVLLQMLASGVSCPRKALLNMERVNLLATSDAHFLANANTPEEAAKFL